MSDSNKHLTKRFQMDKSKTSKSFKNVLTQHSNSEADIKWGNLKTHEIEPSEFMIDVKYEDN